jgi:hypothetical protein
MTRKKKKKFTAIWSNQTDLGKSFGLSAVAVGKLFIKKGLKDAVTKEPTAMAQDNGFVKNTPLKDGRPFWMWNRDKVRKLLREEHTEISKIDYWVNEVLKNIREAERMSRKGEDKMGSIMLDLALDDVPNNFVEEVKERLGWNTQDN